MGLEPMLGALALAVRGSRGPRLAARPRVRPRARRAPPRLHGDEPRGRDRGGEPRGGARGLGARRRRDAPRRGSPHDLARQSALAPQRRPGRRGDRRRPRARRRPGGSLPLVRAHRTRLRPDRRSPRARVGPARCGPHPDSGGARRRRRGRRSRSLPAGARPRARRAAPRRGRDRRGGLGQGLRAGPRPPRGWPPRASPTRWSISEARPWPSATMPPPGTWRIPIAHPRDRERPVVLLSLANLSASTSANSERGRTVGGRRIGHEIDPRSGEPAPDFGSATVVAPSALVADVLSTAFFVCGPERGLALSESLRRDGVAHEVLFLIDRGDGKRVEALASPGFSAHVLSFDPAVVGLTPTRLHPHLRGGAASCSQPREDSSSAPGC